MADDNYMTPEERLSQISDSIIASVIKPSVLSKTNRQALFGQLTPKVFRNENHIIYSVLYNFKDRGITPDEEFIRMYLMRNESVIKGSKDLIDINAYTDLDDNPVVGYTIAVIKQFVRLKAVLETGSDEFKLLLEKYKLEYQNIEIGNSYSQAKLIVYDGIQIGKKTYQGYDDSVAYVKKRIADIDSVVDTQAGSGFIDASVSGLVDDNEIIPEKIGDFGDLTGLNKYLGGIYTSLFYSVMAPTKGGKSKFTTRMAHNVAIVHGNPIVVWAHEGGWNSWLAQLRAVHFDWLYNNNEPDITQHKRGVNQDIILKNDFPTPAIKMYEDASRVDLFTNQNYGNIHCIDRPFNVETFIDEIETAVQLNGAKFVLIDYLQLISWVTPGMSKSQAIGQSYQKLLAYGKKRNIAVCSPAQFTQDFMSEMSKSKDGATHEVRTAGGESSEIVRTPDVNIALYATAEDLASNTMKLLSVPSRMSKPFPTTDIYCDLGICKFMDLA